MRSSTTRMRKTVTRRMKPPLKPGTLMTTRPTSDPIVRTARAMMTRTVAAGGDAAVAVDVVMNRDPVKPNAGRDPPAKRPPLPMATMRPRAAAVAVVGADDACAMTSVRRITSRGFAPGCPTVMIPSSGMTLQKT